MKKRMKKMTSLIITAVMLFLCVTSAYAYSFPTPDWGTLLNERRKLVTQDEFELYTEASVESAPYYGARLEPRGGTYIGMIAEESDGFNNLSSYLTYVEGMNQSDLYYPANTMIANDNVVAMIGWTVYDLDSVNYDSIRKTLDTLSEYNKPMFIRFANEMNESSLGDDPDKYIEIFRNVANMIHEYENFAVVWSPIDLGALDRPFEYYYPGDEYVDWVGVSCYSIKYFQGNVNTSDNNSIYFMTGDNAWATNRIKPILNFMSENNINKPVMISECGVPTSNTYGEDLEAYASPRLRNLLWYLVMKYPQIKMINYFNKGVNGEFENYSLSKYEYAKNIFNEASASGAYIKEAGKNSDFVFKPASYGETIKANNGIVKLYTFAYLTGKANITVNYSVDDNWYHSSGNIPYTCNLNISSLSDGAHTLSIWADNASKSYTFYKSGDFIRFGAEPDSSVIERDKALNPDISVELNGEKISFDQPPIIVDGRTLVPLRAISEALGAEVDWDENTQTITAVKDSVTVILTINSDEITVNGKINKIDVPAQLVNDRTLVPLRAISESFDCTVDWDDTSKTVIITN